MKNLTKKYLEELSKIKTPMLNSLYNEERQEHNYNYCQLRNYSKDLLENPEDKTTKKNLLKLITKLKID